MISFELNNALAEQYGTQKDEHMVKKALAREALPASTQDMIDEAIEIDCCVVYSDISGFSTVVSNREAEEIRLFLERYYAEVIPLVYANGGLIDQIFGDGIISVYARELGCTNNNVFEVGFEAARSIVKKCAGNKYFSTKCALHKEKAVLCNVGNEYYQQATIVGNIMTVVHRVESVAMDEAVNMLFTMPDAKEFYKNNCESSFLSAYSVGCNPSKPFWAWGTFEASFKGIEPAPAKIIYVKYKT